jgi:hypothetical protein
MPSAELSKARRELAAVLRWSARLKYQQGVCNHFSVMAPGSEKHLTAIMRVSDREEPEYAS